MDLPFFYAPAFHLPTLQLDEENSKHIISVLRKTRGDEINLTDGKGKKARAIIMDDNRKRCLVEIQLQQETPLPRQVAIGISLIKNTTRLEWFMEKATEIGVTQIIPMICDRTEKERFRFDRMHQILISAMLQSQQSWLPQLSEPVTFQNLIKKTEHHHKYIAHCLPGIKNDLSPSNPQNSIILIGPEGDFTEMEISLALQQGFQAVNLGNTRLRTETAGIAAAVLLCIK